MFLNSRFAILPALVVVLTWLALFLDWLGRRLEQERLWIAGAHMALGALVGACLCLAIWRVLTREPRWRGVFLWLFGVLLVALARFLRGAAGVAPDLPLMVAVGLAALLFTLGLWRRTRSTLRSDRA